jgi:hypothetical protein
MRFGSRLVPFSQYQFSQKNSKPMPKNEMSCMTSKRIKIDKRFQRNTNMKLGFSIQNLQTSIILDFSSLWCNNSERLSTIYLLTVSEVCQLNADSIMCYKI